MKRGEAPACALKRELKEELGVEVIASKHLFNLTHFYTQYRVKLNVAACTFKHAPKADKTHKWLNLKRLSHYPMPSGSSKIVDELFKRGVVNKA